MVDGEAGGSESIDSKRGDSKRGEKKIGDVARNDSGRGGRKLVVAKVVSANGVPEKWLAVKG